MKLNIGDSVIYGANGVCEIVEITTCKLSDREREYYILEPLFDRNMKIYVPTDNDKMKSVRFALTREQAAQLIDDMPNRPIMWINNEHLRREKYREVINRADLNELVSFIKTLYLKKLSREESGKKLFVSDEMFLKSAERLLYDELAAALGIERDKVADYITEKIEGTEKIKE